MAAPIRAMRRMTEAISNGSKYVVMSKEPSDDVVEVAVRGTTGVWLHVE